MIPRAIILSSILKWPRLCATKVAHARQQITVTIPGNDYPSSGDSAKGTALGEALFDQIIWVW